MMEKEIENEGLIRKYLLGELGDDDRQRIEQQIMTDGEFFDRVNLVESELVDEYARGRLAASELKSFERIFLATSEGREQVDFARALSQYVSSDIHKPVKQPDPVIPIYLKLAASIIIVASVGVIGWRVYFHESEVDKGVAALKQAYSTRRPLEARLTEFDYAPHTKERGGPGRDESIARDRASRILRDVVMKDESDAAARHGLGLLSLSERRFDEAIGELEEALRLDPSSARILSDLGAAYFERGKGEDSSKGLEDYRTSLQHLDRALQLDGSRREALFNRGLLHAEMKEWEKAEQDFQRYLELERDSRWAEEARAQLRRIEEQKTRRSLGPGSLLTPAVCRQFDPTLIRFWRA